MQLLSEAKKVTRVVLLISIVLFAVSFFMRKKLPDRGGVVSQLYQEPIQTETDEAPFEVERGGVTYTIAPLYNYELYGLVLSYNDSETWWDYHHKECGDFINIKDICVIWGSNIETEVYKQMKFWNDPFACHPEFKKGIDPEWWSKFENSALSNNHLLHGDEEIYSAIKGIGVGDQVYVKGYLVRYTWSGVGWRGSSTTRTDVGKRACEVIYVTDFQTLKKANPLWHSIYAVTKYLIIGSLAFLTILFFVTPIRRPFSDFEAERPTSRTKPLIIALALVIAVGGVGIGLAWRTDYLDEWLPPNIKEMFGRGEKPKEKSEEDLTKDWEIYRNEECRFEIKYPKGAEIKGEGCEIRVDLPFSPGTTLLEKYLVISVKESSPEECSNPLATAIVGAGSVRVGGVEFKKEVGVEGAAGSLYDSVSYSSMKGHRCFGLSFILRSASSPKDFDSPRPEFNREEESEVFDQMLSTFSFK